MSDKICGLTATEQAVNGHLAVLDIALDALDGAITDFKDKRTDTDYLIRTATGVHRIIDDACESLRFMHQYLVEESAKRINVTV